MKTWVRRVNFTTAIKRLDPLTMGNVFIRKSSSSHFPASRGRGKRAVVPGNLHAKAHTQRGFSKYNRMCVRVRFAMPRRRNPRRWLLLSIAQTNKSQFVSSADKVGKRADFPRKCRPSRNDIWLRVPSHARILEDSINACKWRKIFQTGDILLTWEKGVDRWWFDMAN